jgi:pilus assembly protein TadC
MRICKRNEVKNDLSLPLIVWLCSRAISSLISFLSFLFSSLILLSFLDFLAGGLISLTKGLLLPFLGLGRECSSCLRY